MLKILEARGEGRGKPGCGIPYSNEPEETMRVKLWVGVAQSGRSPAIWIPMKWDPEGDEAKGRGLEIKQYQAQ